jgi:Flp pilus assembly protein TadB
VELIGVVLGGLALAIGGWLCIAALVPDAPSLGRAVARLHRPPDPPALRPGAWTTLGSRTLEAFGNELWSDATSSHLSLVGRSPETHAAYLAAAAAAGLVVPSLLVASLTRASASAGVWAVSLAVAMVCAATGVLLVVADLDQRATRASRDLRHQLSAYLDVLTMLLASNQGNEGALRLAAEAGDGRLFIELRRRMLEAATAGRPAVSALASLGADLRITELSEIAASASLATSQGAPVARSLAAKTETLRATLQAEQEQEARVRTSKITFPLVAMGLVFIAMGLYPALMTIRAS